MFAISAAAWTRHFWIMRATKFHTASAWTIRSKTACGAAGGAFAGTLERRLPLESGQFDHVVMLAVLEHLPDPEPVLREAYRILAPRGSLIMTWPSAMVDPILRVLHGLALVSDEMESDQHQKRIPVETLQAMLQRIGFKEFHNERFEVGLNNLMVASR